ncbi:UNVERIFIED_CONTAM: hypothetical protein FKN15_062423 [Acipenser sinensis]
MGKKSRQRQQKLQQQQQEEVGDDRWEAVARRLAAELCPGCGEYGHTVAICPSQYREEPERPVREDLHPPKRTNALSSEGVWDWLVEPGRDYEEALPAVINLLWARDGERWETWEQQHHPASLPDIAAMVLNYLAADMRGVPPSPGKKGEAPLPSLAPEGEEPPLPSPATKGEEPERPTPEWEEPERPTPEWEEPERPQPKEGGVGASTAQRRGSRGVHSPKGRSRGVHSPRGRSRCVQSPIRSCPCVLRGGLVHSLLRGSGTG